MFKRNNLYILLVFSFVELNICVYIAVLKLNLDEMAVVLTYIGWIIIYAFGLFQVFDLDGDGGILGHLGSGKGDNLTRRANLVILCLFGLILIPGGILWAVLSSS